MVMFEFWEQNSSNESWCDADKPEDVPHEKFLLNHGHWNQENHKHPCLIWLHIMVRISSLSQSIIRIQITPKLLPQQSKKLQTGKTQRKNLIAKERFQPVIWVALCTTLVFL